jgi:hypothetical protein
VKKHASSSSDKEGFMNSFPSHHSPRHRKKLSSYSCHVFIMSRKSVCKCNRSPSLRKRSSQSMSGKCRTSPFETLLVAHIPSCPCTRRYALTIHRVLQLNVRWHQRQGPWSRVLHRGGQLHAPRAPWSLGQSGLRSSCFLGQ